MLALWFSSQEMASIIPFPRRYAAQSVVFIDAAITMLVWAVAVALGITCIITSAILIHCL